MKNKLLYLLLCAKLLLLSEAKAQEAMQRSIITGNISDYNMQRDGEMAEVIFDDLLEVRVNSIIHIDSTGNFSFQVTRPFSQTGMLIFGENLYSFYVAPGDSQHFDIHSSIAQTTFTGNHAEFNTNLNSYFKLINSFGDDYDIQDSLRCTLSIEEYQTYIAENNNVVNSAVDAFLEESKAGNEFKSWSISHRKYSSMANFMKYRWLKPIKCKINPDSFNLTIPPSYFSFLKEPNLIEKNSLGSQSFYYFFTDYYNYMFTEVMYQV